MEENFSLLGREEEEGNEEKEEEGKEEGIKDQGRRIEG